MKNPFRGLAVVVFALCASVGFAQSQPAKDKAPVVEKQKASDQKPAEDRAQKPAENKRSVLDRPLGEKPDPIIVPAGTEIRVDLVDSKVLVPVRVGFATPIPALSKVAVKINRVYPPAYVESGSTPQLSVPARYAEYGEITAVTIDGKTYPVQTDSVPLASPGSSAVTLDNSIGSSVHDVKFVLSAPLAIAR